MRFFATDFAQISRTAKKFDKIFAYSLST